MPLEQEIEKAKDEIKWICGYPYADEDIKKVLKSFARKVVEECVGVEIDPEDTKTEDEFVADLFDTKCKAFYYGMDEQRKQTLATLEKFLSDN